MSVQLIAKNGKTMPGFVDSLQLTINHQFTGSDYENTMEYAGRICYNSVNKISSRGTQDYLAHIIDSRHTSVLGHVTFSCTLDLQEAQAWSSFWCTSPLSFTKEGWWLGHVNEGMYMLTVNLRFLERIFSSLIIVKSIFTMRGGIVYDNVPIIVQNVLWYFFACVQRNCKYISLVKEPIVNDGVEDHIYDTEKVQEAYSNITQGNSWTWYTFDIHCSRACGNELARHNTEVAFSQRSTRYVNESEVVFLEHPLAQTPDSHRQEFLALIRNIYGHTFSMTEFNIQELNKKVSMGEPDDTLYAKKQARAAAARYLPLGLETQIIFSVSRNELAEMKKQRVDKHADAEIYNVVQSMVQSVHL